MMEIKDFTLIGIALLGWGWGVIQYVLNRKHLKADRAVEKRFEVYSNFMNKLDEISLSMRNDPNMTFGIKNDFLTEVLDGDEKQIDAALLKFNADLIETAKKSLQPTMIINQELNKLKLVASEKLLPKIKDYKILVNDFTSEFQMVLDKMSSSDDLEENAKKLKSIGHDERGIKMGVLWIEIETLMRDELDYYKR